jgi:hypothetical protein
MAPKTSTWPQNVPDFFLFLVVALEADFPPSVEAPWVIAAELDIEFLIEC